MDKVYYEQNTYVFNPLQSEQGWKEVIKMSKPYFETKVVKVEKKRKLDMNPRRAGKSTKYWSNFSDEVLERLAINTKRETERRKVEKAYKKVGIDLHEDCLNTYAVNCFSESLEAEITSAVASPRLCDRISLKAEIIDGNTKRRRLSATTPIKLRVRSPKPAFSAIADMALL